MQIIFLIFVLTPLFQFSFLWNISTNIDSSSLHSQCICHVLWHHSTCFIYIYPLLCSTAIHWYIGALISYFADDKSITYITTYPTSRGQEMEEPRLDPVWLHVLCGSFILIKCEILYVGLKDFEYLHFRHLYLFCTCISYGSLMTVNSLKGVFPS